MDAPTTQVALPADSGIADGANVIEHNGKWYDVVQGKLTVELHLVEEFVKRGFQKVKDEVTALVDKIEHKE